ncbi:hypothetical protein ACFQ4K_08620 [Tistrella bauzanensis]
MAGVDGAAVARSIARALDRADVAALVTTGWGGIDGATLDATAGDRVLVLDRTLMPGSSRMSIWWFIMAASAHWPPAFSPVARR